MSISEINVAIRMRQRGYNHYFLIEGENQALFAKNTAHIGPFLRENFPHRQITASGGIAEYIHTLKQATKETQ